MYTISNNIGLTERVHDLVLYSQFSTNKIIMRVKNGVWSGSVYF